MANYLRDGEAFHFARKHLEPGVPRLLHTHDYCECFWLEQGEALHWINDRKVPLRPAEIVFIRPSDTHAFQAKGAMPCRLVNVMFTTATADHLVGRYEEDLRDRFLWSSELLPSRHRLDDLQLAMLRRLTLDLELGSRRLARIEGFLLDVMTRVLGRPEQLADQAPAWLANACLAARQPDVFRKGASGFVAAAGRGHEHVCRVARQHLGLSPSAYINRIRMEHAARLLAGSDETITDIALDCGLDNLSHFYRIFRGQFGLTPRAYRRRHQAEIVQPNA